MSCRTLGVKFRVMRGNLQTVIGAGEETMAKGITIKFKSDTRSQASVTHLFDAMLGRPQSPTCETCGGITVDKGPSNGRCKCAKDDRTNAS